MPFLVVKSINGTQTYPLIDGKPVYLGRAEGCDIVLDSPSVSRRHAVILLKDGVCGIKDLDSFNGTLLNDRAVHSPQHLTDHDIVAIASFIIRLQARLHENDAPETADSGGGTRGGNRTEETGQFQPSDQTAAFLDAMRDTRAFRPEQEPGSIDFFLPPPEAALPDPAPDDRAASSFQAEAEAIIPLFDPEEVPVLTFAAEAGMPAADAEADGGAEPPAMAVQAAENAMPEPLPDSGGFAPVPVTGEMIARIGERLERGDPDSAGRDRETLPRVLKACFALAADEPLAKEFAAAGVRYGRLFGAGAYLLALRDMLEDGAGDAERLGGIAREAAAIERLAVEEFRRVYREACLRFLPENETMPAVVRAFLRYGLLGLADWWLRPEAREFILDGCRDHEPLSVRFDADGVMVLHADEYLAAVAEMECAPSPSRKLESLEWLTVERLADRSYRRIVNAGSYNIRLKDLVTGMEERLRAMDAELAVPGAGEGHAALARRREVLAQQIERIKNEIMHSILEAVQQAEGRFRRGELRMPDQEGLIRREAEAFLGVGAALADREPSFMPRVLRERFPLLPDVVNDRRSLGERIAGVERRLPGLFDRVLNPADRREEHIRLRLPPLFVLYPASGARCHCGLESRGMDGGRIFVPVCYSVRGVAASGLVSALAEWRAGSGNS